MRHLFAIYNFSVTSDQRFRLGGKEYRLGTAGVRALKLLARLVEQTAQPNDVAWLVPHRDHIREIERIDPRAALTLVVKRTGSERLRRLAIWLRGRCGGTLGTTTISRFSNSPNTALRKEVTRCLKRMDAWAELRTIADNDPHPRIRRMATQSPPKPYATRLAAFSRHIPPRFTRPSRSQLVVSPDFDITRGRLPKPRWLIRSILERIHRLVMGSSR